KALAEQQAILDNIAQALGLKKADEDPQKVAEKLTAELTSTRDELRQARVELAVYKAASRHGGDPDALLDSRSFLRAVAQLNPGDDGFADAIADAIKDAIKANPKLAAQPAPEKAAPPPRSGGEMPGAPARGTTKRPTGLAAAIRRHYGHSGDTVAITLQMAQINARSDIDHAVIDNLRRYSWVMDQMTFDDAVTPGAGGATLTYGFTLLKTARGASFRPIGSEYTPAEAEREHRTVQLRPL